MTNKETSYNLVTNKTVKNDTLKSLDRRAFLGFSTAIGLATSFTGAVSANAANADGGINFRVGENYPPALTGMRGSGYESAYGVGHSMRDHTFKLNENEIINTNEKYDLIIVGAGISGLSAAHFFRKAGTAGDRVLLVDNHDDFGGHAKRNEFKGPDGRLMISNAGTFDLSTDGSGVTEELLKDLGIDLPKLINTTYHRDHYYKLGMSQAVFFDKENFGTDKLMADPSDWIEYLPLHWPTTPPDKDERWAKFMSDAPLPLQARKDLKRLYLESIEYYPNNTPKEKEQKLRHITYEDFLLKVAKCDPAVVKYLRDRTFGSARGLDEMSAMAARRRGMPGFLGIDMTGVAAPPPAREWANKGLGNSGHTTYHFPDGNATVARLLINKLIPDAFPINSVEDSIEAKVNYELLDVVDNPVKVRLNSTVVNVAHSDDGVAVVYSKDGKLYRANSAKVVMACWHSVIPYICPELPKWQKEALSYQVKAPNLWVVVWLRNAEAFRKAGACFINAPGSYYSQMILEHPIDIGGHKYPRKTDAPTKLTMLRGFNYPGLTVKEQYRAGRAELFGTTEATFRDNAKRQLNAMLKPYGFDAEKDILDMTINRWGHGYAYMYSDIYDDFVARGEQPPHQRARQRYGRITIANTDAAGIGSTACAIDQAYRAVTEALSYDSLNIFY